MIKAASLYTKEIDDISLACRQIKEQLDEKLVLLKNSVGIIQCHVQYVEEGIMEQLYKTLQIPLAGGTTVASATNDALDSLILSVLVLTSDDVEFVVSHTQGLEEDCDGAVRRSFEAALARPGLPAPLQMALVFPPIIEAFAGDIYIEAVENVCGKTPVFGPLVVDDSLTFFGGSMSFCNDKGFHSEMTYVLFFGNVKPRFFTATVPPDTSSHILAPAEITKSSENIVYELNNMRAIDYFESVGLASDGSLKKGAIFIPALITQTDCADEVPFVRAFIDMNEDGAAGFRGKMPLGAKFTLGSTSKTDAFDATVESVKQIKAVCDAEKNIGAALVFSCIVRQLRISSDPMKELTFVKDELGDGLPFMMSYGGGEISPTSVDSENNAQNRFHNYTLIACLL
ncbi:MAG: FIST C-terminal domain-containing protein [Spirochaetes bacterium]|nr:FIST C-terminal domain-containing protein [Spirochaetota bacterium]